MRLRGFFGILLLGGALLTGCAPAPAPVQPHSDPYEPTNRATHAFNKAIDTAILRPVSGVSSGGGPVAEGISNVAETLGQPASVLNFGLQGRVEPMVATTFRFLINATFGLGGIFDPATGLGLPEKSTDFGETLHVWGAGEGAYLELPFIGPTTERDAAGKLVDVVIDPMGHALKWPQSGTALGIKLASKLGDRSRFSSTVDSILYDSADSYAQARLLYLQNRRFQLGQSLGDAAFDPYEDPNAQ